MSVSAKHKLVFHGLGDDSAETLRRVKTVLVADLGFSAEQAKDFLEHAPLCIKTAASARDLEVPHSLLEEAGALVMVESPAGSEESSFEASSYDDDYDEDDDSVMIEFDFIDEYQEVTPKPRKKKPVRVYTLEEPEADEKFFDGDSEVNALLSQMSSGTILSKPPETIPVPTPPPPAAPTEKPQTTTVEPQVSAIEPQISAPSSQTTAIEPPEIKAIAPSPTPLKSKSEPKRPPPKIQPVQPSPPKPPALEARKPATAPEPTDLRARTKLSSAERFSLIRDLLYAAVLGVILLSFGFLFVRSRKVTPPRINLDRLAAQIEEEEAAKESARLAEAASQATLLNARLKTPQYSMDADFTLKGGKLESLLLTLTTPQPPEPSDVQLAEGKFAQAWLEKLVVDQMHLTHKPKAEFLASGNAKLFIKSHKGPERVVAKAVITGGYTAEPAVLTAKVLINRGFKELPKNTTFLFETLPNGDYRFFCSLSLNAR